MTDTADTASDLPTEFVSLGQANVDPYSRLLDKIDPSDAELQLRVLWEEILDRFHMVEVVGDPVRVKSSFVKGYHELPVQLHPR